jgi:hypothetical protein
LTIATGSRISPEPPCTPPGIIDPNESGDDAVSDALTAERTPKPLPDIDTSNGVVEVLKRAGTGEAAMLPLVRQLLDRDPEQGGMLIRIYGDVFGHARDELVKITAGNDIAIKESLSRKIDAVRDDLAGPNPTPLERILCERVALCWFDAHEMDRRFSDHEGRSLEGAEYRENRRDRAHRRFLAACRTLATVRKLSVPPIQLNVARQQVNVAGST